MSQVAIIIGSKSDQKVLEASGMFDVFLIVGISWELRALSAHRDPDQLKAYVDSFSKLGVKVAIAAAGLSAALPGVVAAHASVDSGVPVIGVALSASILDGDDALKSMIRMPPGVAVATAGIDKEGLYNAAILACQVVAANSMEVRERLIEFLITKRQAKRDTDPVLSSNTYYDNTKEVPA